MPGISEPKVNFQIIPASQLSTITDQKVLIVGQMESSGSATSGDLYAELTNNTNINDSLFGKTSHLAGMIRAFKNENEISRLDVIPLDDNGTAVKATAQHEIVGTAIEDGTLYFSICSDNYYRYKIDVLSGDNGVAIATKIEAALVADTSGKPFTYQNNSAIDGVMLYTAVNGGTIANDWSIIVDGSVAGITVNLTAWSGGLNDPTLTSILDVIDNIRYQTIVWPSGYDLSVIETLLNARFNSDNQILDGVAIQVKKGTLASVKSYANQNSQSVAIVGNKTVDRAAHKGTMIVEMPDILASEIAAIRALRLTPGALIADYVTTVASNDQFGGSAIGSLPYFNTLLPNVAIPDEIDHWTNTELDELVDNGVSVIGANRAFSNVVFGEFVTSYLTNEAGNPDDSFKYLNTVDTVSIIREFFFENFKNRYAQTRLTDGDLLDGYDMANETSIRTFCNRLYDYLASIALVQSGSTAKEDYNRNLIVSVDVRTGTATVTQAPLLVTQLRAALGTIRVNFGG